MSAPAEEPTLFDSMVKPKLSPAYPDRAPWGTSVHLRAWQAEAMQKYFETNPRDFMAVATPGAGKTTFALTLAKELFNRGTVRQLIVVAPPDHLMRWRTSAGEEMAANLGEGFTKDITSQAWRTALDPNGEWIPTVLAAADKRLTEVRRTVPDAGALVIATDHADAKAYAEQLQKITGEYPTVILSDDREASAKIDEFREGTQRWMVAVRMVSEGVDVPRLAVGVYATSTSTPLFFAQAIGRFVRARKRGETASVFLPSVPQLMMLANDMEVERDHALDRGAPQEIDPMVEGLDDHLLEEANLEERASEQLARGKFEALGSEASFHGVLFDGAEFASGNLAVGSEEEQDFLGIPGLLDAEQVGTLLRAHQREHAARRPATAAPSVVDHRQLKELRNKLAKNVAAWSIRSGQPHGVIHNELRKICGGPAVAQASAEQIQARIDKLSDWFVGRR